jgi:uncharacterized protein YggT (Ycf19 family)
VGLVDFILNLAGLLLWFNWRSVHFDPLGKRTPATLIGTLRRAEPKHWQRWHWLAAISGLLLVRALFYWQIGSASRPVWAGTLNLGVIAPSFLSNSFGRMCLFSVLSFGLTLVVFYLWLLLLSILAGPEPIHGLVRIQLGAVDRWPWWLKLLLPLTATALIWWLASWLLEWRGLIPKPISTTHRIGQSLLIGLSSYLVWKYVIGVLLALHWLNSYVYFGWHPFWHYANTTAATLLNPLRRVPLRTGRVDFAPVAGIVLVFLLAGLAEHGLIFIYGRLLI